MRTKYVLTFSTICVNIVKRLKRSSSNSPNIKNAQYVNLNANIKLKVIENNWHAHGTARDDEFGNTPLKRKCRHNYKLRNVVESCVTKKEKMAYLTCSNSRVSVIKCNSKTDLPHT